MPLFRHCLESLLVFFLGFGWFAVFQPWGSFIDPDGFTHAKMASLIAERGFLHDFPWLDLTVLHTHFVDQHLGLHLLEIPFIKLFGMLQGAQLSAVVFAALSVTIFYHVTRWLGAKKPWLWTVLLITATPFLVRMSLAKSSPLAVSCFLIGIGAWVRTKKVPAFFAGLCFTLVHGGWLLLLLIQGMLTGALIAWNVLRAWVGRTRSVQHLPTFGWRAEAFTALATFGGCILGILLHPNRNNLVSFLWVQVGVIGVQTPFDRVALGEEWRSINVGQLLGYIPLFVLLFAVAFLFWYTRAKDLPVPVKRDETWPRRLTLILGSVALAMLTVKSKRYGEYFIPMLALTCAAFEAEFHLTWQGLKRLIQQLSVGKTVVVATVMLTLVIAWAVDFKNTYRSMHATDIWSFTIVDTPMQALAQVAKPGERVFYPQWDLFPALFAANDKLRYISGMDPTYLFSASTTRADAYTKFVFDNASTTNLYAFIHEDLGANYIIYQRDRNKNLEQRIEQEPRFTRLFEDGTSAVYRIE